MTHPCRKLVLGPLDQEILAVLSIHKECSLENLFERLTIQNKQQLKARLKQLKKHKYLQYDRQLMKIRKSIEHT